MSECFEFHRDMTKSLARELQIAAVLDRKVEMTLSNIEYNGRYRYELGPFRQMPHGGSLVPDNSGDDPVEAAMNQYIADNWGPANVFQRAYSWPGSVSFARSFPNWNLGDSQGAVAKFTVDNYLGMRDHNIMGSMPWYSMPDQTTIMESSIHVANYSFGRQWDVNAKKDFFYRHERYGVWANVFQDFTTRALNGIVIDRATGSYTFDGNVQSVNFGVHHQAYVTYTYATDMWWDTSVVGDPRKKKHRSFDPVYHDQGEYDYEILLGHTDGAGPDPAVMYGEGYFGGTWWMPYELQGKYWFPLKK